MVIATSIRKENTNLIQSNKHFFKEVFRKVFKNWFFIYFSFVNLFLPFYTTIISSLLPPHATLNITATGLTTSFIGIFNQLLFLICISLFLYLIIMSSTLDQKT